MLLSTIKKGNVMGAKIITCLLCSIICSCAVTSKSQNNFANEKKYAIAYCLASSYPESEFSSDARHISGAYLQKGEFGLDMYESIRQFVSIYRKNAYLSKHDRNLNIMQCIDLYESKGLVSSINEIANN